MRPITKELPMETNKPQETQTGKEVLRNIALFILVTIAAIIAIKLLTA